MGLKTKCVLLRRDTANIKIQRHCKTKPLLFFFNFLNNNNMLIFYSKHPKNRVTVVGEFCEAGLCLTPVRLGDKETFTRKEGLKRASRKFAIKRHTVTIPVAEDRNTKTFVQYAEELAERVHVTPNYKKEMMSWYTT